MSTVMKITRNNWFLVVPTLVLGVAATITLYQMHGAGDVRTALQVVTGYQADGKPPLGEYVAADAGRVEWDAEVVSSFYGTMDVTCRVDRSAEGGGVDGGTGSAPVEYRWRVDVVRHAFAPADEATKELMREYDPQIYAGDAPEAPADTPETPADGAEGTGEGPEGAGGGPEGAGGGPEGAGGEQNAPADGAGAAADREKERA